MLSSTVEIKTNDNGRIVVARFDRSRVIVEVDSIHTYLMYLSKEYRSRKVYPIFVTSSPMTNDGQELAREEGVLIVTPDGFRDLMMWIVEFDK